ncbi:MAG: hypothetical protein ACRCX2_01155 [Paraclostridium sp.]
MGRGNGSIVTNFKSNITSTPSNLTALYVPIYNDAISIKCGARISSLKTPLPRPHSPPKGCSAQPEILSFDVISCENKEFVFDMGILNLVLGDEPCKDIYKATDSIVNKITLTMQDVNANSLPRYIDIQVADGVYSSVKICDGLKTITEDFLTYSANYLFPPELLDVSAAGFTWALMNELIVTYASETKLDGSNLYMIMNLKNFIAFQNSYIAKYQTGSMCCLKDLDKINNPAPGASNIYYFPFPGLGGIHVILDNTFNFRKDDKGNPYLPLFNGSLIGMTFGPSFFPVDYESLGIKNLSYEKIMHYYNFSYTLRQSANDINSTRGVKINIEFLFGFVKFNKLGQAFIKGIS